MLCTRGKGQGEREKQFLFALCPLPFPLFTNITEGFERASRKEYVNFLNIAKGGAGELRSLLRVALEIGYLEQLTYTQLYNQAVELSRMLSNQIQAINQSLK